MSSAVAKTLTPLRRRIAAVNPQNTLIYSQFSSSASVAVGDGSLATASSPSSQEQGRGVWSKLLLFVPGAISFGLGTWQIFRRQDKIEMLDYRRKRLDLDPIRLTSASNSGSSDDLEFRRIVCRGLLDEKRSIFVGPRSRSISGVTTNGYYIITPIMPVSGDPLSVQSPILVNRGWVPQSWRDNFREASKTDKTEKQDIDAPPPASKDEKTSWWRFWFRKSEKDEAKEQVSVTSREIIGVVRGSEKPSIFVPANDPDSGQWFYIDVPAMIRACNLPENTIYIEDINENVNPSNPYPVPKDANSLIRSSVMPQDHLNYTLTWYSLSAAVTFMAFKRIKPKKSRR
ncbi:hypothetical protein Droror1_Dr00006214 [Drosera rotundifolia]